MNHLTSVPSLTAPTCPPPIPPAPLTPPSFAMTGTGDAVPLRALPTAAPVDEPTVDLRVVPPRARSRAARAPFVVLVLTLLGGGLVALLLINTALSQGAFAVQSLQKANASLVEQQQQLSRSLADADQPQALAHRAVALGMVPGGAPAFLHLPDGKVLGVAKVAVSPTPPPPPTPVVTATPSQAVTPSPGVTPSVTPAVTPASTPSATGSPAPPTKTTPTKVAPTHAPPTKGKP